MKVYLAGPISGLTYDGAESWRHYVKSSCQHPDIKWYSPLRYQEHLRQNGTLLATHCDNNPMTSRNGIMTRDAWDVQTCDAMLCNLLEFPYISKGTLIEIGMAYALRKPTILVMEDEGNIHEHVMLDNAWTFRCNNLDDGIRLTQDILLP